MKLLLLMFIVLIVSFSGFYSLEHSQEMSIAVKSEKLPANLTDEDFIVSSDNTILELGSNYNDLKTDEKIIEAYYANEQRAYDTFIYENFIVSNGLEIFMIALTTPIFQTSRGVKVGDSILNVFEKYGVIGKVEKVLVYEVEYYRYSNNQKALLFYVDESEMITRIQFEFDGV